jgi:HlyD family secretion protein
MKPDLERLRIDDSLKTAGRPPRWAARWILAGVFLFLVLGLARLSYNRLTAAVEVEVIYVKPEPLPAGGAERAILNATGYIIAAHKIQLASKVVGRVAWIGVERGDRVRQDQVIVRLEDDEYRAQLEQARGQLASLEARLQELLHGSRPEEIAAALANLEEARAELENSRRNLERTRQLVAEGVFSQQALDDATARFEAQTARVQSLDRMYELVRIGPRQELIEQVRGQIRQARGAVAYYETQLTNTVIRAPINGTILERNVEIGEFVTTSFVGERGAKGYVVSLADLNDLQVELDINQNDFARLGPRQRGIVTTDAYPDRRYDGVIQEISPEANRQKATVQVKVKILNPDEYLRPEMNTSVMFLADESATAASRAAAAPVIHIPAGAVRDGAVFLVQEGRAVRRTVKAAGTTPRGLRIEEGLTGGEELIVSPPAGLGDGARVRVRRGSPA